MPRLLILLMAGLLSAGEPVAAGGLVASATGNVVGGPIGAAAGGLTCGGSTTGWGDLAFASFPTSTPGFLDGGVITVAGEQLRGVPRTVTKGKLAFAGDLHGVRELPVDALAALVLGGAAIDQLGGCLAGAAGAILANGDRVAGQLAFLNDEAVGIDTGRRIAQVPRSRVAVVVLRPCAPVPATAVRTWLLSAGGDRLLVETLAGGPAGLAVNGPSGRIELPLSAVAAIWRSGARCLDLGSVTAKRATSVDRLGTALPTLAMRGFPRLAGGLVAGQGLRLSARGEAAWATEGAGAFCGWVACGDAQPTLARISIDGKVAWERTLLPGAAAVPVSVPLKGGSEITLRCDPAADGETGARSVLWCHPTLVK